MRLTFESELIDGAALIRCQGRIAFGAEVEALQAEVDRQTKIPGTDIYNVKHVVLQLSAVEYVDSSGLGALVRLYGSLRAVGGGLNLCALSPTILKTVQVTHLDVLFPPYATPAEAIAAFSTAPAASGDFKSSKTRIVCVDTSHDLLAGLSALLTNSGYEVFTTRYVGEAATLVNATRPRLVICGPGMMALPTSSSVLEKLGKSGGNPRILHLPSDYHTTEAAQAGPDLVSQVRSLLA